MGVVGYEKAGSRGGGVAVSAGRQARHPRRGEGRNASGVLEWCPAKIGDLKFICNLRKGKEFSIKSF